MLKIYDTPFKNFKLVSEVEKLDPYADEKHWFDQCHTYLCKNPYNELVNEAYAAGIIDVAKRVCGVYAGKVSSFQHQWRLTRIEIDLGFSFPIASLFKVTIGGDAPGCMSDYIRVTALKERQRAAESAKIAANITRLADGKILPEGLLHFDIVAGVRDDSSSLYRMEINLVIDPFNHFEQSFSSHPKYLETQEFFKGKFIKT